MYFRKYFQKLYSIRSLLSAPLHVEWFKFGFVEFRCTEIDLRYYLDRREKTDVCSSEVRFCVALKTSVSFDFAWGANIDF